MATNSRVIPAVLLFALAAGCGGYSSSPTTPTTGGSGNGTPVTIPAGAETKGSAAYVPNPVTITAGAAVTWKNTDNTTHTTTSDTGVFNGSLAPGASYSYTFPTKGTFTYHCSIHPGMVGTVTVQ
jgi:plastocyanin